MWGIFNSIFEIASTKNGKNNSYILTTCYTEYILDIFDQWVLKVSYNFKNDF